MRWLVAFVSLLVVGCGDNGKRTTTTIDAAIDAPGDAPFGFPCMKAADCGGNACCLSCSPGGACFSQCMSNNLCRTFDHALCEPDLPCTTASGDAGTCREQALGWGGQKFWVCSSM